MNQQYTFSKRERIKKRKQIDRLFSEGRSFTLRPFKVYFAINDNKTDPPVQILIAIPKKEYKRPVDRNKIKRRIKEAYRLNKLTLFEHLRQLRINLHVGFVYSGNSVILSYGEIERKLISCLHKLESTIVQENIDRGMKKEI
jgi:ribonuclease P protein component